MPKENNTHDDIQARKNYEKNAKDKAKSYADATRKNCVSLKVGDKVLVRQSYTNKFSTPFDPSPLTVTCVKGTMITAQKRDGSCMTRNISHFKCLSPNLVQQNDEDFDVDIDIPVNQENPVNPNNPVVDNNMLPRGNRARNAPRRLIEEI